MSFDRKHLLLYAVTDRAWTGEKTLSAQVEEALQGGATCIQLREKELTGADFLEEARDMHGLCRRYKVPLIINDNIEVALACGADGIHIGQHDMPASAARQLIGPGKVLGVSAQTVAQARQAEAEGADYLGVGAVFPTATKTDADAVSRETLTRICQAVTIPVVAIGGITKMNIGGLRGTGIDGVALVSAIFACADITGECRKLRELAGWMVRAREQGEWSERI